MQILINPQNSVSELNGNIGTAYINTQTAQTYRTPCSCMCLVIQYGRGNLSDLHTLTLDDEDILSKAISVIQSNADVSYYCRIIPIYVKQGSLFRITSDHASIIF